jgi:sugar phosphate isomerase/epimerase
MTTNNLGFHCHSIDHFDQGIIGNGLRRGEFYNFPPEELPELRQRIAQYNLATSVHAPLERLSWYPSPPTFTFLCEADKERRQLSLRMIEETMKQAQDLGAEYAVVHFPSPCSSDVNETDYDEAFDIAWYSAELLANVSRQYGTPIHIEGFGPSPFLNVDFLTRVITEFPTLRYCFDTGHMHIQSLQFGFDFYDFARDMAPHIGSLHLWNNRGIEDYLAYRHIPVHPSQKPEEGWGDIARILQLVLSQNSECAIILESGLHYPEQLGRHDIGEGVAWVKDLISALS